MNGEPVRIDDFPVVIKMDVLWGDMDYMRHVNNARFFRYMESARIAYLEQVGLPAIWDEHGIGPIMAKASCDFIKPVHYPDVLQVGCRTVRLSKTELDHQFAIHSEKLNAIAAIGTGLIVCYDYAKAQRAKLPETVVQRILEMEKALKLDASGR